jgi:hypothetical protein
MVGVSAPSLTQGKSVKTSQPGHFGRDVTKQAPPEGLAHRYLMLARDLWMVAHRRYSG